MLRFSVCGWESEECEWVEWSAITLLQFQLQILIFPSWWKGNQVRPLGQKTYCAPMSFRFSNSVALIGKGV